MAAIQRCMKVFFGSLWPTRTVAPYRRLITAFVLSPLILALILSLLALIPAWLNEPNGAAVVAVAFDTTVGLVLLMTMFALTIGLTGMVALWAFGQRGLGAWLLTGLVGGVLAGEIIRWTLIVWLPSELMISCALVGGVYFVMVRMIAGIQRDTPPS